MVNILRHARVLKFNGDGTADVRLLDDGWPAGRVPILGWTASSQAGEFDVPDIDPPTDPPSPNQRYAIAVVGKLLGSFVIVGFLPTAYSENLFPGRAIRRYSSDVYTSVDAAGNVELTHPSGAYVRIGTTAEHEDLTGKDLGKRFQVRRNKDKPLYITVANANAGKQVSVVRMDPLGNIDVDADGTISGSAAAVQVEALQAILLKAPSIVLDGAVKATGVIDGDVDITVGPVSLINHGHQVTTDAGPGIAQTPVGGGPGAPSFGASTNPTGSTRGLRNANPGNLRAIPGTTFQGQIGVDAQGFMIFSSQYFGMRALSLDLLNQQRLHGLNTVQDIVTKFAPPSENDTAAYIADVSSQLGVDPTAPLDMSDSATLSKFTTAVVSHENGIKPFLIAAPPSAPTLPTFPQIPNSSTVDAGVAAAKASVPDG